MAEDPWTMLSLIKAVDDVRPAKRIVTCANNIIIFPFNIQSGTPQNAYK